MWMAILTDGDTNWRPSSYSRELWNCRLDFNFPMVKLIDYEVQKAVLEKSQNPIAKVIAAHLAAIRTKGDPKLRYKNKVGRISEKLISIRLYWR